ncbi:GTP-binding protein [Clostridium sp. SM-530-WT-3G]|uniref:GTP-binding protein n=1 Tax=Clostridium sp. SM-530-WT-3G TaxID=2725303 RepID=UPI00145E2BE6|nr:GTP-binding protein [Clostridium sp. SM-530-WT-3G]NME82849.1 GTP-binding protein [Clostridium sp. SM-530-WT-3G]
MKIDIEIVTGFLGAGKTSFINSLLRESQVEGEKIIVFQLESGKIQLCESNDKNYPVKCLRLKNIEDLKRDILNEISCYKPNRIIIEYNGTFYMDELIKILKDKKYREFVRISTIFFVADGKSLNEYINNIGNFIIPFIRSADMIIVNNTECCNEKIIEEEVKRIKSMNPKAFILKVNNKYTLNSKLKEARVLDNGYLKKLKVRMMNSKKI